MIEDFKKKYEKLDILYKNVADKSLELSNNKKYWQLLKDYSDMLIILKKGLTNEQSDLLNQIFDLNDKKEDEYGSSVFKEGFKLGFLAAIECLTDKKRD